MQLANAEKLAQKVIETMRPYCERVEVAGSIRRGKSEPKDIEIVAIPKRGEPVDMFDEHPRNLLYDWAQQIERQDKIWWIKPGTHEVLRWPLRPERKYWRGWLVKAEIKLDLFLSTPETWGATYLIRTGSAEFNAQMFTRGHLFGYQFINCELHDSVGNVIGTPKEETIFDLFQTPFVPPQERSGRVAIR